MTNWMWVRQAAKYHCIMEALIIMSTQQSVNLFNRLTAALQEPQHGHATRHGARQALPRLALLALQGDGGHAEDAPGPASDTGGRQQGQSLQGQHEIV